MADKLKKNFIDTEPMPNIVDKIPTGKAKGKTIIQKLWSLVVGAGTSVFKADISGIWLGAKKWADGPFRVDMQGNVTASSVTISGGTIDLGAGTIEAANFVSTVATGTAPFAPTSTTVNTNLNADLLDGLHANQIDADTVDGLHASQIDADKVDGYHASSFTLLKDSIALTDQNTSIGATNITNSQTAGRYLISYYLACTTLDVAAMSVLVTFAFTDGAGSTTIVSSTLALTALGRTSGVFMVQLASGAFTYATTVDTAGTSKYALYISSQKVG